MPDHRSIARTSRWDFRRIFLILALMSWLLISTCLYWIDTNTWTVWAYSSWPRRPSFNRTDLISHKKAGRLRVGWISSALYCHIFIRLGSVWVEEEREQIAYIGKRERGREIDNDILRSQDRSEQSILAHWTEYEFNSESKKHWKEEKEIILQSVCVRLGVFLRRPVRTSDFSFNLSVEGRGWVLWILQ